MILKAPAACRNPYAGNIIFSVLEKKAVSTRPERPLSDKGVIQDVGSLRVFASLVELKSFSEVARRLGVAPATISKHIGALERDLKTPLVNRTTRKLFVTEAGQRFYEHCLRILAELEQAEADLQGLRSEPSGHLRVSVPMMLGMRRIAPVLPQFMKRYPQISIELNVSIEMVDMYQERIDVAVRVAETLDPGLIAVKLAPYRRVFCAAPAYLERNGVPRTPEDLRHHNCLISRGAALNASWPIKRENGVSQVRVSGNFTADNGEVVRDAALAGLGIMMTARWLVEDDLKAGRLAEILPGYAVQSRAVYAVMPPRSQNASKTRVFVDFLKEQLKGLS
jgi:DNA-binding transcriptional LysR family regulator